MGPAPDGDAVAMSVTGRQVDQGGTINVLVAVAPRLFAERLGREPDITVAEICCSATELASAAGHEHEDVVFLDPSLVASSVTAFARGLPQGKGRPQLVMLTGAQNDAYVPDALKAGCSSFASTDLASTDLVAAVRDACSGHPHMDDGLLERFVVQLGADSGLSGVMLTDRERDVLDLTADNLTAQMIADQLELSVNTVRHHLQKSSPPWPCSPKGRPSRSPSGTG